MENLKLFIFSCYIGANPYFKISNPHILVEPLFTLNIKLYSLYVVKIMEYRTVYI